jgi:hypothetical protein
MKRTMGRSRWDPFIGFPITAGILLGVIGSIPGLSLVGPLGQGSTGQLGALLGCFVGLAAAVGRLRNPLFLLTLFASSLVWMAALIEWKRYLAGSVEVKGAGLIWSVRS